MNKNHLKKYIKRIALILFAVLLVSQFAYFSDIYGIAKNLSKSEDISNDDSSIALIIPFAGSWSFSFERGCALMYLVVLGNKSGILKIYARKDFGSWCLIKAIFKDREINDNLPCNWNAHEKKLLEEDLKSATKCYRSLP